MKIQFKILIFTAALCLGALSFYFLSQKEQKAELFSYGKSSEVTDQADVKAFKAAVKKAKKKQVNTVEEFLKLLPDDLRNRYTLVYGSRSIQEASLTHPRALVFSKDVSVIYSFNGSPDQQGYHQIEIMYLDYKTGKVEMQEIRFSGGEGSPFPETVVENNPEACIGCHGTERSLNRAQNLKPIWDNYFFWPGIYGSVDDDVWRVDLGLNASSFYAPRDRIFIEPVNEETNPEYKHFKNFFSNIKPSHKRYSELLKNSSVYKSYADDERDQFDENRPNINLTVKFAQIMAKQFAIEILKVPEFKQEILKNKKIPIYDVHAQNNLANHGKKITDDYTKYNLIYEQLLGSYYESLIQRQEKHLGTPSVYGRAARENSEFLSKDKYIKEFTSKFGEYSSVSCVAQLLKIQDTYGFDVRLFAMDHFPKALTNHEGNGSFCGSVVRNLQEQLDIGSEAESY